jgi:Niemann-Pick C1 protein
MISAEVVPFLILAIGVDNMFLISRAERDIPACVTSVEERISYAMKEIGPSIFAAAFCESFAFVVGMLTDVPALKNFCLIAALGVACDFVLQMLIFVAALALDNKRIKAGRQDIICCFKKKEHIEPPREEWVRAKFQKHYVPALFNPLTQCLVFLISVCLCIVGWMSCKQILLGLNGNVGLVQNSDIYDYFETLYVYGDAGAPAYLVFNNVNYTNPDNIV